MKVEVCRPTELGRHEVDRWRELQKADPALSSPFLCPEFSVAVGSLDPRARVAVLSDGAAIVGFFPFERSGLGIGTPICHGHNDAQGLIGMRGLDWDAPELLRACGLAVWEFDHLVEGQRVFQRYQVDRLPAPAMDLSGGFDQFFDHLRSDKSKFRELARRRRKLAREVGEENFVFQCGDSRALHDIMKWKSAQYLRTGWSDRFASSRTVELLELLLDMRTESFSGVLSMLYVGGRPIAGHFGIRSETILAHWFPAFDRSLSPYSPGMVANLELARSAPSAGIERVEMGPGGEDYKRWFCNRDLMVGRGRVVRPCARGGLHRVGRFVGDRLHQAAVKNSSIHRVAHRARAHYVRAESTLRRRASQPLFSPSGGKR